MPANRLTRAARRAGQMVIDHLPDDNADKPAPPPPQPTVKEEGTRVLRVVRQRYTTELVPWKTFTLLLIGGVVSARNDVSLGARLMLILVIAVASYLFTKFRLSFNHVGGGRLQWTKPSPRKQRRITSRARRSFTFGAIAGVWLLLAGLTHTVGWLSQLVWATGAAFWALASYQCYWRPAPTARVAPADRITPADTTDDTTDDHHGSDAPIPNEYPTAAPTYRPRGSGRRTPLGQPVARDVYSVDEAEPLRTVVTVPGTSLLKRSAVRAPQPDDDKTDVLTRFFAEYQINASVSGHTRSPSITRYSIRIGEGEKINKLLTLKDQLRLRCGASALMIHVPIPGTDEAGIDLPNAEPDVVSLREILESATARNDKHPLLVALGRNANGAARMTNLGRLPHVIIAGATGGGKSVFMHAVIGSILCRAYPDEVRMLMIDLKRVELTVYNGIPHLVRDVITDPGEALNGLQWVVRHMEMRYDDMALAGCREIDEYNLKIYNKEFEFPENVRREATPYPYLLVVIDELAELMMASPKQVEEAIVRLAQLARAAGIYLLLATQKPIVDVVTGLIKANVPARIAFATSSLSDSRVILDRPGAEKLLGNGDGLFLGPGAIDAERFQSPWISIEEIRALVRFWRDNPDASVLPLPEPPMVEEPPQPDMDGPRTAAEEVMDACTRLADDTGEVDLESLRGATPRMLPSTRSAALHKLHTSGRLIKVRNSLYRVPPSKEEEDTHS